VGISYQTLSLASKGAEDVTTVEGSILPFQNSIDGIFTKPVNRMVLEICGREFIALILIASNAASSRLAFLCGTMEKVGYMAMVLIDGYIRFKKGIYR
jgi:hypothetical protein